MTFESFLLALAIINAVPVLCWAVSFVLWLKRRRRRKAFSHALYAGLSNINEIRGLTAGPLPTRAELSEKYPGIIWLPRGDTSPEQVEADEKLSSHPPGNPDEVQIELQRLDTSIPSCAPKPLSEPRDSDGTP